MHAVRYALRSLARTPGFTATAVVILAVSVGAAAAVFSLLHALLLRPLPVPNPHELIQLSTASQQGRVAELTWDQYRALAARQSVFSTLIASIQQGVFTVDAGSSTLRGSVSGVSGNYYQQLGARAAIGRLIEPSDIDEASITGQPVAVLSWSLWQREFGGDPSVIGRVFTVEAVPLTVIGVAARGFMGLSVTIEHDITVPITLVPAISQVPMTVGTTVSWVATTGRLQPGISLDQARAQILALWPALLRDTAPAQLTPAQRDDYQQRTIAVESGATGIERGLRRRYTQALYVLQAIATIVVLIAGTNLCALIVARTQARRQELAVRLALGASRARVLRELILEGALLGLGGAAVGVPLAGYASGAITRFLLRDYAVPTALDTSPDRYVVMAAVAASVGVSVIMSALAARWATGARTLTLSPGATRTVARSARAGRVLVGAQIALSIVLLSQASLLTRSVYGVLTEDSGLTGETILEGSAVERVRAYRDLDPAVYYRLALERIRALPGVTAAAFSTWRPEGGTLPIEPVGAAGSPIESSDPTAEIAMVSPGFFETMGVAMVRGRDFTFADTASTRKVTVISEEFERRLFGAGHGLGRQLRLSRRPEWQDVEVVGIVRDARVYDVRGGNRAIAYTPAVQAGSSAHYKSLIVRAPASTAPAIQRAVDALGVEYIPRMRTLDYIRGWTLLQERLMAGLSGFFAALALALVSIGLYGLLSYVLSLRRKEFGIRLALGAVPARVAAQLAASVGATIIAGIGAGLVLTVLTTPVLRSVLINTSPHDPLAIGGAAVMLLIVALLATAGPARRTAQVQPLTELRQD